MGLISRFVPLPPASSKPFRLLIHTELPESSIAPFLTKLQARVKGEEIVSSIFLHLYTLPSMIRGRLNMQERKN